MLRQIPIGMPAVTHSVAEVSGIGDTDGIFNPAAATKNPSPSALFKMCILVNKCL
jgi:hypothetical protein